MIPRTQGLYRRLITLALPIMGANLLQTLYNLADTYFLGFLGREAVSAPAVAFTIILFLVVFGMGFSMAATTLISQAKGKEDQEGIDFYASQIFVLMLALSVVMAAAGLVFTRPLLRLMQVPADVFPLVEAYLRIIFLGIPFMFVFFIYRGILQGVGNSITPFRIQLVTVIFNVAIDPLLIFGIGPFPAMGVEGAALATVIARITASAMSVPSLISGRYGVRIRREFLRPRRDAMRLISRIGFPTAFGQGVSALGFVVLQGVVNILGAAVIAAFGIGNRIIGIFMMPAMGLSQATAVIVGQSLGAKNLKEAKRGVSLSISTVLVFIGAGMTLTFFYGQHLVRFFIDDPEVIALGAEMFRIVSVSVVFYSLFMVINGAFQGGGDTKPIMVMNILRLWGFRVPFAYVAVLILEAGASGIWWSMFFSNLLVALGYIILYRTGRWSVQLDPDTI